jgi:hypothetical protein
MLFKHTRTRTCSTLIIIDRRVFLKLKGMGGRVRERERERGLPCGLIERVPNTSIRF